MKTKKRIFKPPHVLNYC